MRIQYVNPRNLQPDLLVLHSLWARRLHRTFEMETTPESPACTDEEYDSADCYDCVVHVQRVRRVRSRQDEQNANEHRELKKMGVSEAEKSM